MRPGQAPLEVVSDGVRLPAGVCAAARPRGLVAFLHGIPSTAPPAPDDEGYPGLARRFARDGFTSAWVEMRGVRGAGGYFSIEGWVRDAGATIDALRAQRAAENLRLAVVASSAGGAVATEVVARGSAVDALVLLATPAHWLSFGSDGRAGARRIQRDAGMKVAPDDPGYERLESEFLQVTAERSIAKIGIPILIVHGTADDVVPIDHAYRLAERAPDAELVIVDGGPHQLRRHDETMSVVARWLVGKLS